MTVELDVVDVVVVELFVVVVAGWHTTMVTLEFGPTNEFGAGFWLSTVPAEAPP